ncbi:DUF2793 domain-containing protein [Aestuariivirga litoralis]|uniref:DUF2793 domain-containing protein n=1 Tax=Aestuariivirga litoralis TaxID=2650924 RepID=UPI0018C790F8|nr:DUF2793 domain-containing protein [Aestuariivirga litoralis]MBG1232967.1 DUF2793 domain-containing protein [Aestuariivirga litoralis]
MAFTDYVSALLTPASRSIAALITALEKRGIYVVADGENPTGLTPGNVLYLAFTGRIFRYDATDSLTAHDGTTCIVTADGKRFKADNYGGSQKRFWNTKSKTLTAPPGSPALGDHYVVATGGTGAWAGKDKYVAVYTARGWVFLAPNPYDIIVNDADSTTYYYTTGGAWSSGFPFTTVADNSVSPIKLKYLRFGLKIINQTTNATPGSPADGNAYVVGPTPTGAFGTIGARNIAIYEGSAWVGYAAYDGATVFDGNLGVQITYRSATSVWTSASSYSQLNIGSLTAADTTVTRSGLYTYSATTAPTSAASVAMTGASIAHAAKKASAKLEITVAMGDISRASTTALNYTLGLFVDGAASATDWVSLGNLPLANPGPGTLNQTFYVDAPADTASHTYSLRIAFDTAGAGSNTVTYGRVRMTVKELS